MAETIAFDLVAPERLLFSEPAEMVVAPGEEGDFGILPGHAPFLSSLRPGTVTTYENGKPGRRFFVSGGFAEATPEQFTILANRALAADSVDMDALARERETLVARKTADEAENRQASVQAMTREIAFIDMVTADLG